MMRHNRTALLLFFALTTSSGQHPVRPPVLIRDGTLVDVRTGDLHPHTSILISDDGIVGVSKGNAITAPPGAEIVDARGKFLIPGLIDAHVHLFQTWNFNWPDSIAQLGWILASGVTTVRDASGGGILEASYVSFRDAARSGRLVAPRIVVSGQVVPVMRSLGAGDHATAIRQFGALGLDQVKLIGSATPAEALGIIRESRAAGLRVYGHTKWFENDSVAIDFALDAIEAGISGLSHSSGRHGGGTRFDQGLRGWLTADEDWQRKFIRSAIAREVWWEPTLTVTYAGNNLVYAQCTSGFDTARVREYFPFHQPPQSGQLNAAASDTVKAICAAHWKLIRDFYRAGGKIVAGSDFVPFAPLGVIEETRLLTIAGLPPLAALQAATTNAAHALGLGHEIGSLEVGKRADVVVLDGDPLADISNLRRVVAVIANGRVVDLQALWERKGTNPPIVSAENLSRLDSLTRAKMRSAPDSAFEFLVTTNDLLLPGDLGGLERFLGFRVTANDGREVTLRGPAGRSRGLARLRFVERVSMRQ